MPTDAIATLVHTDSSGAPICRHWSGTAVILRRRDLTLLLWIALSCLVSPLQAEDSDAELRVRPSTPPTAASVLIESAPELDGDVLNDPVWRDIPVARGFWQTTPDEGRPASEKTEVRVAYTHDTLYFGVVCFDRRPGAIIASDSRRDSSLDETDSFQIILDTFLDRQNGFVFGTNPAGMEYDGQVLNEGQGTGSGGGFNINWDGSWEVRARVGDFGWSAEFAIPFRTLRYPGRSVQSWGLNFQRNIRRRNETAFWAPLSRQHDLYRLSMAGTLIGLEIPRQGNLKAVPYMLGRVRGGAPVEGSQWTGEAGADFKYSLTSSLTLDLTYNTDFAQVEVDEQQINLDRFSLFFPEKRPFFLENAGLFALGDSGQVDLFFSRRIGISPGGIRVPILGGARLSGNLAGTSVGFLSMQTEEVNALTPANHFTVGRLRRELPNRSYLGGIFVNRQSTGRLAAEEDHNRAVGFDGQLGIGRFAELDGYLALTSTPGLSGDAHAFRFGARYDSEAWRLSANFTEVGDNFNPEVGFLRRRGYRRPDFLVFHRYRPEDFLGLHEIRPHVSYRSFWDFDGFQETGFLHLDSHWEWKNGYELHTGVNLTQEGIKRPFEIFPGVVVPPGTYKHQEAQFVFLTNQGAPASFDFRTFIGGFFGGDRVALNPSLRLRTGESFNTQLEWDHNRIDLPFGKFETNLIRARVSYSFTPRIFVQSLVQYNDRADVWSMNLRLGWLQAANTGLFIVYNDTRGLGDFIRDVPDRSLIVKISRIFDLLQ